MPLYVNGKQVNYTLEKGYAVIKRSWKKGDKVTLDLPMDVGKVIANEKVKADKGRFALQRGPIVYCLEGIDQKDSTVQSIIIDTSADVTASYNASLLNGITVLTAQGSVAKREAGQSAVTTYQQSITAIPYYSWNNRGAGEMEVWIPYETSTAKPKPAPTIASKAKASSSARSKLMLKALNDQADPIDSKDQSTNYLHWWPAKDTTEWIQYDFDQAYTISESSVYWYDDKPWGGCDLPASWKLLYKDGDNWLPVKAVTPYELAKDKYNVVKFEPVKTTALRMVIQLPKNDASGVHEWSVE